MLTTQKAEADSQAAILSALDLATEHMRRRLGESDVSLQKFNVPLMQATTGSLAALKAFTQGEKKRLQQMDLESIPDYKLAVDLDPQFALGYARLGTIYSNAAQPSLGRQYYQKAFDLRDRTTDRERLYIAAHYYDIATGEIDRSIGTYELWRTVYPRDIVPANNLAATYLKIGQPQKAVELARTAIQLDPTLELPYAMLTQAYLGNGDYSNTHALCNDPIRSRTNAVQFHQACFTLASVQKDEAGMRRQLDWARGTPLESALLDLAARTEMHRGRVSEARRLFSEARRSAFASDLIEPAAEIELDQAVLDAEPLVKFIQQRDLAAGTANFRIGLRRPTPKWKASPPYAAYRFRPLESIPAAHARRFVPGAPGAVGSIVRQAWSARSGSEHDRD